MDDELVQLTTADNAALAEIIKNVLEMEGVPVALDGELQAGFTGLNPLAVRVLVRKKDYQFAEKVLRERPPLPDDFEQQSLADDEDSDEPA